MQKILLRLPDIFVVGKRDIDDQTKKEAAFQQPLLKRPGVFLFFNHQSSA